MTNTKEKRGQLSGAQHVRALAPRLVAAIVGRPLDMLNGSAGPCQGGPVLLPSGSGVRLTAPLAAAFDLSGSPCGLLAPAPPPESQFDESATRSQVLDWLLRTESGLYPAAAAHTFSVLGLLSSTGTDPTCTKRRLQEEMSALDAHLATRTFLVAERLSVADVCAASCLWLLQQHLPHFLANPQDQHDVDEPGPAWPAWIHARRWLATMAAQRGIQKVLDEFWGSGQGRILLSFSSQLNNLVVSFFP